MTESPSDPSASTLTAEPPAPPATPPAVATATEPPRGGGWGAEIGAFVALVCVIALGQSLFYRASPELTLGLVGGLMVAVSVRRWWSAALVAFAGTVAGATLATVVGTLVFSRYALWLPPTLEGAALAAAVAAGGAALARKLPTAGRILAWLCVVAIVGAMWASGAAQAALPSGDAPNLYARLAEQPRVALGMSDEETFQIWIGRIRAGEAYYSAAVKTFTEQQAAFGGQSLVRITSPLSYRPPTLYYVLALLPPGAAWAWAMLAWCSMGVVAAYVFARCFANRTGALASAALAAAMFSGFSSMQLLEVEAWVGVCVLCSVTAFALARTGRVRPVPGMVASVAFAVLAVAFREIALPLLFLGLTASLSTPQIRAERVWRWWTGGIVLAIAGLAAHWAAAAAAFAGATANAVSSTWFHPNGSGLVGAGFLLSALMMIGFGTAILIVAGLLGSLIAPRERPARVLVGGIVVGGAAALMLFHPPGFTGAHAAPGYWGYVILPTLLACAPLVFSRLGRGAVASAAGVEVAA